MREIALNAVLRSPIDSDRCHEFIEILERFEDVFWPDRIGMHEPLQPVTSAEDVYALAGDWPLTFLWERRSTKLEGSLFTRLPFNWPHAALGVFDMIDDASGFADARTLAIEHLGEGLKRGNKR